MIKRDLDIWSLQHLRGFLISCEKTVRQNFYLSWTSCWLDFLFSNSSLDQLKSRFYLMNAIKTALTEITDELLAAISKGFIFFDFSAAFDIADDHSLLVEFLLLLEFCDAWIS